MATNDFMTMLTNKLKNDKGVSESTATAYLRSLYMLNGKKPFKSLTFLKKTEDLDNTIKEYADNTQKSIYTSIVSVLSLFKDKPAYSKTYKHYFGKMIGKRDELKKTDGEKAEKTEKENENWISWDDVIKTRDELKKEIDGFGSRKVLDARQFEDLLAYLVVSLYTFIPPRRNQDYLDMFVIRSHSDETPTDKNYLVLNKKGEPTQFIFNKYKTQKKYGAQTEEIPEGLKQVLSTYLGHHPDMKGKKKTANNFKLLVDSNCKPLDAVNAITRILNKIFGKKVGSSMLRHIYLSSKYDIAEMNKDAAAMAHSVDEQRKYMRGSGGETHNEKAITHITLPTLEVNEIINE